LTERVGLSLVSPGGKRVSRNSHSDRLQKACAFLEHSPSVYISKTFARSLLTFFFLFFFFFFFFFLLSQHRQCTGDFFPSSAASAGNSSSCAPIAPYTTSSHSRCPPRNADSLVENINTPLTLSPIGRRDRPELFEVCAPCRKPAASPSFLSLFSLSSSPSFFLSSRGPFPLSVSTTDEVMTADRSPFLGLCLTTHDDDFGRHKRPRSTPMLRSYARR